MAEHGTAVTKKVGKKEGVKWLTKYRESVALTEKERFADLSKQ
jgi:hypothetical protein